MIWNPRTWLSHFFQSCEIWRWPTPLLHSLEAIQRARFLS